MNKNKLFNSTLILLPLLLLSYCSSVPETNVVIGTKAEKSIAVSEINNVPAENRSSKTDNIFFIMIDLQFYTANLRQKYMQQYCKGVTYNWNKYL